MKLRKYIAVLSMMVIALNFTSILHYNLLAAHFGLTAFADEHPETEEEEDDDAETCVVPLPDGGARNCTESEQEVFESGEEFVPNCFFENDDGVETACTEEDYRRISNQVQAFAEREAIQEQNGKYADVLTGLNTCLPTDPVGANEVCDPARIESGELRDKNFRRLLQSLANDEIRTVLEEPIGTENIFKRARVCKTKFLKDKWGRLQPVNREDDLDDAANQAAIVASYNESEIVTDEDGIIDGDASNVDVTSSFFNGREFLITTGECEEFFVLSCRPTNMGQRSIGSGQALPINVSCNQVQVLFATSGAGIVKSYVGLIYRWASGIIGVIAVLVMVINGILISNSGGDQGKIDSAKGRIIQSITAIAVLFLAGIILNTINPNFFTDRDLQESPVETEEPTEEPESSEPTEE